MNNAKGEVGRHINVPSLLLIESLELSQDSPVWYPMAVKPGDNINIKALVEYLNIDSANKRKALLLIKAYDELGNEVDTSFEQMAWSEAFDAHFKYLAPTGSEVDELYSAKVPEGVVTIHFGFSPFLPKVGEQIVIRDLSIYPKGSNETFKTSEEPQIPTTHQVESLELSQDSPVWYPMAVKPGDNINIKALVEYLNIDSANKRKALLLIKAYDELGNEVDTSFEQMAWSEAFDAHFKYLAPTDSEVEELYSFEVPEGVVTIHFGFSPFLPKVGEQVVIRDLSIYPDMPTQIIEPHKSSSEKIELLLEDPKWYTYTVEAGQNFMVEGVVEYYNTEPSKGRKATLLIRMYDKHGEELESLVEQMPRSQSFDAYFKYLRDTKGRVQKLLDITVPKKVSMIHIGFSKFLCLNHEKIYLDKVKINGDFIYSNSKHELTGTFENRFSDKELLSENYVVDIKTDFKKYELVDGQKYLFEVESGELNVDFKAYNNTDKVVNNAALTSVDFLDEDNSLLPSPDNMPVNKDIGSYFYVKSNSLKNPTLNRFKLNVIDNKVKKVALTFHKWNKDIDVYIESELIGSTISNVDEGTSALHIEDFINSIKPNDKVILLYTTAPYIGHETLELRPNRMAKEYIKLGYKVIFFSFSKVPENLINPEEYNNNLFQCLFEDIVRVSSLIANRVLREKIFICSSFPDILALTTMNKLKLSSWTLVYEIRDDMEEFNRVGYSKWYDTKLELSAVRTADKVVTVSPRLAQKAKVMAGLSYLEDSKVAVIQNAAPDSLIDKTAHLRTLEVAYSRNSSNKVGYIGHLTPAWFDWSLIINSAKINPHIVYEIIGHGMPNNLNLPKNIIYLGPKSHDEFIEISKSWRLGLIPFIKSPLTYGVDPNKIYEYLAVGLKVVTTSMGSVKECPATYVYERDEEFDSLLSKALEDSYDNETIDKINNYVNRSRWSMRAKQLLEEL